MDKESMRAEELEKYIKLYEKTPFGGSQTNHGDSAISFINDLYNEGDFDIDSLCDVGCGHGIFCVKIKKYYYVPNVYGVDFASIPKGGFDYGNGLIFKRADACNLPFKDKSIDYLTCFDMLEHLLEFDVINALKEFKRVTKIGMLLKPCYRKSHRDGVDDEDLHPTVKHESWWIEQIEKIGVTSVKRVSHFGNDEDPITSVLHVIL